ncbi:UDP-Galactose:b-N-acetylglucosamine b1,4-galactosyltransferase 4, partial [Aphelenchoides avenae]
DREAHLRVFLHNLHSLLQKQQLDYAIFVVEQVANQTFNRAKLMNVGFAEAIRIYDWQCFVFHDVDLMPEDDRNVYSCPDQPRHMSVAVDKFGYE